MDYTFAADAEKLANLAKFLTEGTVETVTREIGNIYTEIGNLESSWSGVSYNQFAEGCGAYKPALETVPTAVSCFAKTFSNASDGVAGLEGKVKSAIETISS